MSKEKAPRVTRQYIEDFLRKDEERKSLNRRAADLERELGPIKKILTQLVEEEGGTTKTKERSGYVLAIKTRDGQVKWKDEFIRVAGLEETERIAANPPEIEYLSIEKAA